VLGLSARPPAVYIQVIRYDYSEDWKWEVKAFSRVAPLGLIPHVGSGRMATACCPLARTMAHGMCTQHTGTEAGRAAGFVVAAGFGACCCCFFRSSCGAMNAILAFQLAARRKKCPGAFGIKIDADAVTNDDWNQLTREGIPTDFVLEPSALLVSPSCSAVFPPLPSLGINPAYNDILSIVKTSYTHAMRSFMPYSGGDVVLYFSRDDYCVRHIMFAVPVTRAIRPLNARSPKVSHRTHETAKFSVLTHKPDDTSQPYICSHVRWSTVVKYHNARTFRTLYSHACILPLMGRPSSRRESGRARGFTYAARGLATLLNYCIMLGARNVVQLPLK
jgi:hypothetical protein